MKMVVQTDDIALAGMHAHAIVAMLTNMGSNSNSADCTAHVQPG